MKRFIYFFVMVAAVSLIAVSCGSGRNSNEQQNQEHVHGDETHVHGDETHAHEHATEMPSGQEEFVVGDTTKTDSLDDHTHNHDHGQSHDHGDDHQH